MHWIALRWRPEAETGTGSDAAAPRASAHELTMPAAARHADALRLSPEALGWWALRYTPHVAWLDEALMLEVSACERLWGGRQALMRQLSHENPVPDRIQQAQGATSLIALARLRMFAIGHRPPAAEAQFPLSTLTVAREHLDVLEHMGCRTWGDVARLPRGGLARRFGKALREALDVAFGLLPDPHRWLTLPDVFEQKIELPALAESAPELMWSANRLLAALQVWLRARQRGAVALELQWTLDLKRYDGVDLPPGQSIAVRTGEPTQDLAHLRRLMAERLALTKLAAPASWLVLRTLETSPWAGASTSFLPEDNRKGDRLHELVERLSARLGAQQVVVPVARADHRPEAMQGWHPALQWIRKPVAAAPMLRPGSLYPAWLLREPVPLEVHGDHPHYGGALRRLVGPQRVEAGWWCDLEDSGGRPAMRDYYIAESPLAGLVWVYRERLSAHSMLKQQGRWFLQGLYA